MIVFSELLKSFINEKNISVKKLAANVQMDRTLIQKYTVSYTHLTLPTNSLV